jgi:hypothetical protein
MTDSGEMLSQAALIHCPSSAHMILSLLLVLVHSSEIEAVPRTGDVVNP